MNDTNRLFYDLEFWREKKYIEKIEIIKEELKNAS